MLDLMCRGVYKGEERFVRVDMVWRVRLAECSGHERGEERYGR